jgi:hypothetical protein
MDVVLPKGLVTIQRDTFNGCTSLTTVTLHEGFGCIGINAFQGCTSLTDVTLPKELCSIERGAFRGCINLTTINLPEGIEYIRECTFEDCSSLVSIILPAGLTLIGKRAFQGCTSLTSVNLPEGLRHIARYAFDDCSSLTSVTIPEGIGYIGTGVFYRCTGIVTLVVSPLHPCEEEPEFVPEAIDFSAIFDTTCETIQIWASDAVVARMGGVFTPYTSLRAVPQRLQAFSGAATWAAVHLQRYWAKPGGKQHRRSPARKKLELTVMLVGNRLGGQFESDAKQPFLPPEMWFMILGFVKHHI